MLNPQEEAKFARLEKNCQELGVPAPPSIHINFEVKDKDGNLIFKDKQRGHSWTRNFYNLLLGAASGVRGYGDYANSGASFGAGYLSSKTTSGAAVAYTNSSIAIAATSGGIINMSANANFGILVGTGNTAFSAEHHYLATAVAHGNSAGQLSYSAQAAPTAAYDNTAGAELWAITIPRLFNNNSGGSIVIAEVGLVFSGQILNLNASYFLIERSVLSPTVTVPNGAQLTVTYEISMSFAAID